MVQLRSTFQGSQGEVELAMELTMWPNQCSAGEKRWTMSRGCHDGALGEAARLGTRWRGRESSPKCGGARRGRRRAKCGAMDGWVARLRRLGGVWRSSGRVGADWRGCRRCTADRWPDTRRRVKLCPTESMCEAHECSDWNPIFVDVLLTIHSVVFARICPNG